MTWSSFSAEVRKKWGYRATDTCWPFKAGGRRIISSTGVDTSPAVPTNVRHEMMRISVAMFHQQSKARELPGVTPCRAQESLSSSLRRPGNPKSNVARDVALS